MATEEQMLKIIQERLAKAKKTKKVKKTTKKVYLWLKPKNLIR